MKKKSWALVAARIILGMSIALPCFGQSDKLETVQLVLKEKCNLTLSQSESLKLVKSLFLVCVPGTIVEVNKDCRIHCLKENSGMVLGQ